MLIAPEVRLAQSIEKLIVDQSFDFQVSSNIVLRCVLYLGILFRIQQKIVQEVFYPESANEFP